jgi:hypothetical protein
VPTAPDKSGNVEPQYSILSAVIFLLLGLAVFTLIPHEASARDFLGFHTLCSFAPLSTLVLLGVAGFVWAMRNSTYRGVPRH